MIIDFENSGTPASIDADIVIVGAGAAGLCLANELKGTSARVVLLESGGWDEEPKTQSLYETIDSGISFKSAMTGRFRIFGGTTTKWGGQSLPLMPIDFERRPWVPNSGWPISYPELTGYYQRANSFLDVDLLDYEHDVARMFKETLPDLAYSGIYYHYSKWAKEPNLRVVYRKALESSVTTRVILHANVTDLTVTDDCITAIRISTLDGKTGTVRAKLFILATGALEVARLLLNQFKIAARFESLLGRYLQDHPATPLGTIQSSNSKKLQRFFNGKRRNGRKYSVRLSLAPEKQSEFNILNASAGFLFSLAETSPLFKLRKLFKREITWKDAGVIGTAAHAAKGIPSIAASVFQYLANGQIFLPGAKCDVTGSFEQIPDAHSRVTLSDEKDLLGMRKLNVHWRISDETYQTALRFCKSLKPAIDGLGIGEFIPEPWLQEYSGYDFDPNRFHDQNHHLGTTKMGESYRTSVVNKDLKVHELSNLYVASSSVFPTGGHSNPTLTMLALCVRLADKLKKIL